MDIVRNGIIGIATTMVLGGAVTLGIGGQEPSALQPPAVDATSLLAAASSVAITPDAVDCTTFTSKNQCTTSLVLRPTSASKGKVFRWKAVLARPDGTTETVSIKSECTAGCADETINVGLGPALAVRLTLHLQECWRNPSFPLVGSGFLGLVPAAGLGELFEGPPKRLRVLAPSPSGWQFLVILLPAALALLIGVAAAVALRRHQISLSDRMGAPSWKASESWGSNLTVGAGLVNGVLALSVISDLTVFMTKPAYGVAGMLLGSLVLLAPIVYGISRRKVTVTTAPLAVEEFEGFVAVFVVAGVLTLWASGGQLLVFALLIGEVWRAGALGGATAATIVVLTLAVMCALLKYGFSSMVEIAKNSTKPGPVVEGREQRIPASRAGGWSLL